MLGSQRIRSAQSRAPFYRITSQGLNKALEFGHLLAGCAACSAERLCLSGPDGATPSSAAIPPRASFGQASPILSALELQNRPPAGVARRRGRRRERPSSKSAAGRQ